MNDERSPWLDNAKGVLILLVIWGHLIEQAASITPVIAVTYGAIYLFHMPAFVLISGMVSSAELDKQALERIVRKLLLPLVVFQALYWPSLAAFKPASVQDPLAPQWLLWFLLSLATWRVMLPIFLRVRFPVIVSIGLAIAAGFVDAIDHTLSLSRTFFFFPAFLVGHLYKTQIEALAARTSPSGAGILILLAGSTGLHVATGAGVVHLYGSTPYSNLTGELLAPAMLRLQVILAGIAAAVAFLTLVPRHSGRLTELGRRTMSVFLLHGFVVLVIWAITPAETYANGGLFLLLTGLLAVLIAFSLANVARVFQTSWAKYRSFG